LENREPLDIRTINLEGFTLICPRCWHTVHVDVTGYMHFDGPVIAPLPERMMVHACCPICYNSPDVDQEDKDDDMFTCDDKLVPYIVSLNKAGYRTQFCCQGHIEVSDVAYGISRPYVIFQDSVKHMKQIYSITKKYINDWLHDSTGLIVEIDGTSITRNIVNLSIGKLPDKMSSIKRGTRLYIGAGSEELYEDYQRRFPSLTEHTISKMVCDRMQRIFFGYLDHLITELGI